MNAKSVDLSGLVYGNLTVQYREPAERLLNGQWRSGKRNYALYKPSGIGRITF